MNTNELMIEEDDEAIMVEEDVQVMDEDNEPIMDEEDEPTMEDDHMGIHAAIEEQGTDESESDEDALEDSHGPLIDLDKEEMIDPAFHMFDMAHTHDEDPWKTSEDTMGGDDKDQTEISEDTPAKNKPAKSKAKDDSTGSKPYDWILKLDDEPEARHIPVQNIPEVPSYSNPKYDQSYKKGYLPRHTYVPYAMKNSNGYESKNKHTYNHGSQSNYYHKFSKKGPRYEKKSYGKKQAYREKPSYESKNKHTYNH